MFVIERNRLIIFKKVHDQPASEHFGVRRTLIMLQRTFHLSKMRSTVEQYMRNCHECQKTKSPRDKYFGLLQFLPIANQSWTDLFLNFVTDLSKSQKNNAILMIVDRFFKMRHFISCITEENETTVKKTAKLLIKNVWKLHELFSFMIFDRGPQFISSVWNFVCKTLKIKAKLSIVFHSKIDNQSEIVNQEIKQYLRIYVNYQQDNWVEWLLMAKYAVNACVFSSIEASFFFINYGFEPRMSFDEIKSNESRKITRKKVLKEKATIMMSFMKRVWEHVKKNFQYAQDSQKRFADLHRKAALNYHERDLVWLSAKNLRTKKSSKKLDHKMIKSFKIIKILSNAYRLELSDFMKIHNIFHIFFLKFAITDFLFEQIQSSPSSMMIDEEDEFDVEKILNFKLLQSKLHYKIKWEDYSSDDKWYLTDNFEHAKNLIKEFHEKYSTKLTSKIKIKTFNYKKALVETIKEC